MKHDNTISEFRRILRRLENEISRTLSLETDCCGVTVAQCHLLLETEHLGSANLGELSAALELDKSTLSRTVDALCQNGMIDRKDDPDNRRKVSIQLTGEGKAKTASINALCDKAYTRVFSFIPEDRHSGVIEAVELLAEAMKKSRKEATSSCCRKK
jgi:DNA-binding MarR family transcriptional regulator